jgi:hypothetical protein
VESIKKKYEKLRLKALAIVQKTVGDYCYTNDITFEYGFEVHWRVYVEESKLTEDCDLIADPNIHCCRIGLRWAYEVEPEQEILNTIGDYEDMFGNLPLCDCNKGDWRI